MQETWIWSLGQEDPLEKEMVPIPVFLPGKSHGQMKLMYITIPFRDVLSSCLGSSERLDDHMHVFKRVTVPDEKSSFPGVHPGMALPCFSFKSSPCSWHMQWSSQGDGCSSCSTQEGACVSQMLLPSMATGHGWSSRDGEHFTLLSQSTLALGNFEKKEKKGCQ